MNLGCNVAFLAATVLFVKSGAVGVAGARLMAYMLHCLWIVWFVFSQYREREGNACYEHQ
jgi:hypothetical protein